MSNFKICTKCHEAKKALEEFYQCLGKYRSECKSCTIKRNVKYQRENKTSKRYDYASRRLYMRKYYYNNKLKFAQYRAEFKKRYPNYYKQYFKKNKKNKNEEQKPLIKTSLTTCIQHNNNQTNLKK